MSTTAFSATCLVVADLESTLHSICWLASGNGAVARIGAAQNLYEGLGITGDAVDRIAGELAAVAAAITPELTDGTLDTAQAETLASLAFDAARINAGRFPLAWRGVAVDPDHLDAFGDPLFNVPVSPEAPVEVRVLRATPAETVADTVDRSGWSLQTNLLAAALWLGEGEPAGGVISVIDRRRGSPPPQHPDQAMRRSRR